MEKAEVLNVVICGVGRFGIVLAIVGTGTGVAVGVTLGAGVGTNSHSRVIVTCISEVTCVFHLGLTSRIMSAKDLFP